MGIVWLDPENGTANFGDQSVPFQEGADGSLILAGKSRVRSITFDERQQLLASAQIAAEPIGDFVARLRNLAVVHHGKDATDLVDLFALVLAGADHHAPATTQAVAVVMVARQWSLEKVMAMPAREVDEHAQQVMPQPANPWNSWVFPQPEMTTPNAIVQYLARQLLERQPDIDAGTSPEHSPFDPVAMDGEPNHDTNQNAVTANTNPVKDLSHANEARQPAVKTTSKPDSQARTQTANASAQMPVANPGFRGIRAKVGNKPPPHQAAARKAMPALTGSTRSAVSVAKIRTTHSERPMMNTNQTLPKSTAIPQLSATALRPLPGLTNQAIALPAPQVHQTNPPVSVGSTRSSSLNLSSRQTSSQRFTDSAANQPATISRPQPARSQGSQASSMPADQEAKVTAKVGFRTHDTQKATTFQTIGDSILAPPGQSFYDIASQLADSLQFEADLRGLLP